MKSFHVEVPAPRARVVKSVGIRVENIQSLPHSTSAHHGVIMTIISGAPRVVKSKCIRLGQVSCAKLNDEPQAWMTRYSVATNVCAPLRVA